MKKLGDIARLRADSSARTATQTSSSPKKTCSNCRDVGFTENEVVYQQYGTSRRQFCKECEKGRKLCLAWISEPAQQAFFWNWKRERINRALLLSGVDGLFRDKRLSDLKTTPTLYGECQRYVERWEEMRQTGYGFYFWGNVGAGKTHTATALANELMEKKLVEVLFLNMPETATRVKNTFNTEVKTPDSKLFRRMKEADLLVLDDLGVEKYSDWLSDQVYQIVDHRWRNHMPMIITSNQSLNDLGRFYKPQVASRLYGCCKPMKFALKDRRKPNRPLF